MFKNLGWFNFTVVLLNVLAVILTVLAYVLPFLAPKLFPILSVFTLFLPLMLVINLLFFFYWFFQWKRQFLLSGVILLIGIPFFNKYYKFSSERLPVEEDDFVLMSYNVRLFNLYEWIDRNDVQTQMDTFIRKQNPDILCIQEYSHKNKIDFKVYKYKHILMAGHKTKTGHAILSKYPIIHHGEISFDASENNAIFADIKRGKDTLRVYSIHLESVRVTDDVGKIEKDLQHVTQDRSKKMIRRMGGSFKQQQAQAEQIQKHRERCQYPIIICGDLNNSAFSYVYRTVKGDLNDAFEEKGKGFGKTYNFKYYPARIDYIFVDDFFEIKEFKSFSDFINSDHMPILTRLNIKKSN
jgi:endonuclease/exonuclease/phosphatase family metal-dependent hydrolase